MAELLTLYAFSQSHKFRPGVVNLLFVFYSEHPELSMCVCLLPVSQSWTDFLCWLASHLQRLIIAVHKSLCQKPAMKGRWPMWSFRNPYEVLGTTGVVSPGEGLPDEVWEAIVEGTTQWLVAAQSAKIFFCIDSFESEVLQKGIFNHLIILSLLLMIIYIVTHNIKIQNRIRKAMFFSNDEPSLLKKDIWECPKYILKFLFYMKVDQWYYSKWRNIIKGVWNLLRTMIVQYFNQDQFNPYFFWVNEL